LFVAFLHLQALSVPGNSRNHESLLDNQILLRLELLLDLGKYDLRERVRGLFEFRFSGTFML